MEELTAAKQTEEEATLVSMVLANLCVQAIRSHSPRLLVLLSPQQPQPCCRHSSSAVVTDEAPNVLVVTIVLRSHAWHAVAAPCAQGLLVLCALCPMQAVAVGEMLPQELPLTFCVHQNVGAGCEGLRKSAMPNAVCQAGGGGGAITTRCGCSGPGPCLISHMLVVIILLPYTSSNNQVRSSCTPATAVLSFCVLWGSCSASIIIHYKLNH